MIVLSHNGYQMHIDPMGAEMRKFVSPDGKDHMWCGDASVWKGVSPILFPIIGFLKDGQTKIAGETYQIAKHGFARASLFEVTKKGEDFVTLTLCENEQTKAVYPFDFALRITHRFVGTGYETRMDIENHTDRPMPCLAGFHGAFVCPMNEGETFLDYIVHFDEEEEGIATKCGQGNLMDGTEIIPLGDDKRTFALDYQEFLPRDTFIFAGLKSRAVNLIHKDTRKGIRVCFPHMEVLALWTMAHVSAPYLCIEPWQGMPSYADETGHFEDKPYHITVAPHDAYSCHFTMEEC